ncbi:MULTISPECIES: hypothetical protein [unclassified Serratia (in: enterobacteria)]|uniref:hypothetical protein n=1 Tax=unclassified Serratia (in: enterobacteria) TaxID=2647522 RepID=UPI000A9FF5CA|nr:MULTISPECIES: hypothetical protein [unclassified Serratia (in: enterobacteria)]
MMNSAKKTVVSYNKPSREQIVRSVVTSTAIETGQPSDKIEASLKIQREKFAHLRLGI